MADNTPWTVYWAWATSAGSELVKKTARAIEDSVSHAALEVVVERLSGAPIDVKESLWSLWARNADISGYTGFDIVGQLDNEPVNVKYSILAQWVQQVDLSKYGLPEVKVATRALNTYAERLTLWQRWVAQADLRVYDLEDFVKGIKEQNPTIKEICMVGYLRQNNCNVYPAKTLTRVLDSLPKNVSAVMREFAHADAPAGYVHVWRSVTATTPEEAVRDYLRHAQKRVNVFSDLQVQRYSNGAGWAVFEPKGA